MIAFLVILVLVFVAVDLVVRFIVDPYLSASNKKTKVSKSFTPKFDPTFKLATATMFDGGKPHNEEKSSCDDKDENISKDASDSLK